MHAHVVRIYLHKKDIIFLNDILFMQIYPYFMNYIGWVYISSSTFCILIMIISSLRFYYNVS